jgi:hypothetical protein
MIDLVQWIPVREEVVLMVEISKSRLNSEKLD